MVRTLEEIEGELLQLPKQSRARLMERLLLSLREKGEPDEEEILRAWVEEAERRDQAMANGAEEGVPIEEVFSKIRASFR